MLTVSWIPLAGTGRMISTGETSGQIWETYGTSSPVNKRGQSKSALASLAEANENVTSNWYSEGIVRGHVSEKSFSWAFYEHFSFFTETYSLNGIESTKRCLQFFESYVGLFYAN